ncbi:MAG: hypothetical protein P8P88_09405 [Polaribacter sp.]|nr:hypothetical protein [Polaribacter sp.]
MKNFIILLTLVFLGSKNILAQKNHLNLGGNMGLSGGEANTSLTLSLESNYLFNISDKFKLGPSIMFLHYFGGERNSFGGVGFYTADSYNFLPTALSSRYLVNSKSILGLDFGYAIGINGTKSTSYFRPIYGYNYSENMIIQLSYSFMKQENSDSVPNLSIGVTFKI